LGSEDLLEQMEALTTVDAVATSIADVDVSVFKGAAGNDDTDDLFAMVDDTSATAGSSSAGGGGGFDFDKYITSEEQGTGGGLFD